MKNDFELDIAGKSSGCEKSDSSSENEVAVTHEQNCSKKILNDVLSILKSSGCEKSDSSSENEVAVTHEQNCSKKILNDVLSILKILLVVDM